MNQELENAYNLISDYLTDNNQHTLGKLLDFGLGRHYKEQDEILYRATLAAQNLITYELFEKWEE